MERAEVVGCNFSPAGHWEGFVGLPATDWEDERLKAGVLRIFAIWLEGVWGALELMTIVEGSCG